MARNQELVEVGKTAINDDSGWPKTACFTCDLQQPSAGP